MQHHINADKDMKSVENLIHYEKAEWPVQKFFFIFMMVFLSLALLGIWGGAGPLNKVYLKGTNYSLTYQTFLRPKLDSQIALKTEKLKENFTVSFNANYLDQVSIRQIIPEPVSQVTEKDKIVYIFSGVENGTILFELSPSGFGYYQGEISINGDRHKISHFIYF